MAVTYYSTSSDSNTGSSTLTYSHTVNASADFLVVTVGHRRGADDVSGVTYNGTSMTRAIGNWLNNGVYIYYLVAPSTGANDVVVSVSAGTDRALTSAAMDFGGVAQSDVVDDTQYERVTSSESSLDTTVTSTVADALLVQVWTQADTADRDLTPNNITETVEQYQIGTSPYTNMATGYKLLTTATDYTTGWDTNSANNQLDTCTAVFKPGAGSSPSASASSSISSSPSASISSSPSSSVSSSPSSSVSSSPSTSVSSSPSTSASSSVSSSPSSSVSSSPSTSVSSSPSTSASSSASASASSSPSSSVSSSPSTSASGSDSVSASASASASASSSPSTSASASASSSASTSASASPSTSASSSASASPSGFADWTAESKNTAIWTPEDKTFN